MSFSLIKFEKLHQQFSKNSKNRKYSNMRDIIEAVKPIIISQIRADQSIQRITRELLEEMVVDVKVTAEGRRKLKSDEQKALLEELENHFIADLQYENDLVELERGKMINDL